MLCYAVKHCNSMKGHTGKSKETAEHGKLKFTVKG